MSNEYVNIPAFSLRPDRITFYEIPETKRYSEKELKTHDNLNDTTSKYNEISFNGRKRIQKAISFLLFLSENKTIRGREIKSKTQSYTTEYLKGNYYYNSTKYKITFVTLTLPSKQKHEDKYITANALNPFLTLLRTKFKVSLYVWKAEKQENGNIHYHILTNSFINHVELRKSWNKILCNKKLRYVQDYQAKMQRFFKDGFKPFPNDKRDLQTQRYAYLTNKNNHFLQPNSTDIHAVHKVRSVVSYMAKYLAKDVTKTTRVKRIDTLREANRELDIRLDFLENENCFLFPDDERYIKNDLEIIENKLAKKENLKELDLLLSQGVTGRIWGQCQILSKLSAYKMEGIPFADLPDLKKMIKNTRFVNTYDTGSQKITTYFFDIEKTPLLRQLLMNHVYNILSKIDFEKINKSTEFFTKEKEKFFKEKNQLQTN